MNTLPPLSRRGFLRSSGVLLALPALESSPRLFGAPGPEDAPKRFVAIQTTQGIMPHLFFPRNAGAQYTPSPYLELLAPVRDRFTVFSGMSHPNVDGGHMNEVSFLTGAPHPAGAGFRNRVSVDQLIAETHGKQTRFPYLATIPATGQGRTMSFNRSGVGLPPAGDAAQLYRKLFINGTPAEVEAEMRGLAEGRSLLDQLRDRVRRLEKTVTAPDRETLDRYFTSIRELEGQLLQSEAWLRKPKPKPSVSTPPDIGGHGELLKRFRALLDVIRLALETDSTRVATVFFEPLGILREVEGVQTETHALTHHGNRAEMIAELRRIEEAQFRVLLQFLDGLRKTPEAGKPLLDNTAVLYGTCMGNANGHSNQNWPLLLAGGGFRHGQHLAFDPTHNEPIGRLFASVLDWFGMSAAEIPGGNRTLTGLDRA